MHKFKFLWHRAAYSGAAADALPARARYVVLSTEMCILLASLFFTLFSNYRLWSAWADGRDWKQARNWLLAAAFGVLLTALHSLLLGFVASRRTTKPVLALLFPVTALATFYMQRYTVYFDASMIRNIFHTDVKEARELLSPGMLISITVFGLIPALMLVGLRLRQHTLRRAALARILFMLGALAAAAVSVLSNKAEFAVKV